MRLRALLALLITVMLPPLLVLGSVRLLMTEAYLSLEYHKPDFPPDPFGLTREDRLRLAPVAVRYLLNGESAEYLNSAPLPDGTAPYNARELKHMADVKGVVTWAFGVLAALLALFAVCSLILARSPDGRAALRMGIFRGGLLMLTLLGALVVYILLDWDRFFTAFHNLFFAEGTWRFYESDTLIRLFPIRFWQDAAITVGAICALAAALAMLLARPGAPQKMTPRRGQERGL